MKAVCAKAVGLKPNTVSGQFQIRVTAKYQDKLGHTTISQTNALTGAAGGSAAGAAAKAGFWSTKTILIVTAVAAGALAGGVVAATRGGGSSAPPASGSQPIGITPGNGSVGAPH